jgi:hypothetical protein
MLRNKPLNESLDELEARYQAWVASGCGESEPKFSNLSKMIWSCVALWAILGSIAWISYLFFTRV